MLVCDLHIAVLSVINLGNNTCSNILISCVSIVPLSCAKSNKLGDSGGCHGKLNCEFLGLSYVAASNGCSNLCSSACAGNCKSELVAFNNCVLAVRGPRDSNVIIILTNGKDINNSAGCYSAFELKLCKLCINLFLSCLFNELQVSEAVCGHRNEVRITGVKDKDTCYVCCVAEVISVKLIDSSLVCVFCSSGLSIKSGGEIGYVCSYVGLNACDLEVEILAVSCCKILRTESNALDCYRESYVLREISVTSENELCNINRSNSLDCFINDRECTALDFLHAGIRLNSTGNGNCHTNLNTLFNRVTIIGHLVRIVTALAGSIHKEEVVSGVTNGLTVHSNNDTFNKNYVALLSCHVSIPRKNVVHRNSTVVSYGCCLAVTSCDGSGKCVRNVLGCLLVEVYKIVAIFKSNDLNLLGVGSPSYSVSNACYSNLTNYFVVSAGYRVNVLIHVLKEGLCLVNVVLSCISRGNIFAEKTTNEVLNLINNGANCALNLFNSTLYITSGEYSEAHNKCQEK